VVGLFLFVSIWIDLVRVHVVFDLLYWLA
jgi:hypothetical protein